MLHIIICLMHLALFGLLIHFVIYKDSSLVVLICQSLLRDGLPFMPNLTELDVVVSRQYVHHCLVPVTSITSACPLLQMFTFKVGILLV